MKGLSIGLIIAGSLAALLCGAIFVVTLALIPLSDGKIDVDEAAPAIVGSFCCCSLSLVFVLVGVILLLVSRSSRTNQQ